MEPRTPRLYHVRPGSAAFTALGSVGVVCAATATMLVGAVIATGAQLPVMAIAVIAQALMLVVPIAAMRGSDRPWAAIGLARARDTRYYLAALLIGASAWYLNMRLVSALPVRDEDEQLVALIDRPSTLVVLLAVAVAPALCEEVLFRGVLVRGLATRLPRIAAIVLGAAVFSLYHMRVVQLVPTFTLGLVLGYLALRARSALPGVLAHFSNNAIALLVV
ncbi:MAG TPA: CPBP family intramembrane glutamic endopeptidase, partial [Kofleriaceae bacterium]|nr:CPBP family intramembrane glutamic endopeptidase [Kofleriaceae bacterium]